MDELENLNLLKKLTQGNVNKRVKWGIWTDCSPSMLEGFVVQAVCIPARKRDEVGHFHLNAGSVRGAKPTGTHWLATFDLQGNLLNVSRMISNLDTLSGKDGFRIFGRELMYPNVEDARRNKEALDLIENLLRGLRTDPRLLACESPGYDLFP